MTGQRSRTALAAGIGLYLAAGTTDSFVTVPQRDKLRSLIGPPSVDVSADGRFVAFETLARLVPADTDDRRDIYVLDRSTGHVTLESLNESWSSTMHPRMSGDGRYLVFEAESTGHSVRSDVVFCDRSARTATLLRSASGRDALDGSSHSPDISDDGRVVAFTSSATNAASGADANGAAEDVYVLDVQSMAVRRVSVDTTGTQSAQGFSFAPSLSADGRVIAFTSSAPYSPLAVRQMFGARAHLRQVYVRDETRGTTTQISQAGPNMWPDGVSAMPAISGDGRYVAFSSEATNLVRHDRNRAGDVFLYDRLNGTTLLVSRSADGGPANGRSVSPLLSFDGRYVAFQSDASNLVCARRCPRDREDINLLWDVFVADLDHNLIERASADPLGGWMEPSMGPSLDAKGLVVAFSSRHPIDDADRLNDLDLFVRARRTDSPVGQLAALRQN